MSKHGLCVCEREKERERKRELAREKRKKRERERTQPIRKQNAQYRKRNKSWLLRECTAKPIDTHGCHAKRDELIESQANCHRLATNGPRKNRGPRIGTFSTSCHSTNFCIITHVTLRASSRPRSRRDASCLANEAIKAVWVGRVASVAGQATRAIFGMNETSRAHQDRWNTRGCSCRLGAVCDCEHRRANDWLIGGGGGDGVECSDSGVGCNGTGQVG